MSTALNTYSYVVNLSTMRKGFPKTFQRSLWIASKEIQISHAWYLKLKTIMIFLKNRNNGFDYLLKQMYQSWTEIPNWIFHFYTFIANLEILLMLWSCYLIISYDCLITLNPNANNCWIQNMSLLCGKSSKNV